MTSICLVRHGETDWNKAKKIQGETDIPLNELGIIQAKECQHILEQSSWDIIIASPLQRAKQTAEIINENMQLPFVTMSEFRERAYGDAEGMTFQESMDRFPNGDYPNRESRAALTKRALQGIETINEKYPHKKVLLIAHGGVINAILSNLSNGEIGTGKTRLINACISNIQRSQENWQIKHYNQIAHLSKYN